MPYSKRQIIEVAFDVGDRIEEHPAVIISEESIYNKEAYYLCAMISTTAIKDEFSFFLEENYTTKKLKKGSCVRTQLISPILENQIIKSTPINHLTVEAFDHLIDHIAEVIFGVSFIYE